MTGSLVKFDFSSIEHAYLTFSKYTRSTRAAACALCDHIDGSKYFHGQIFSFDA